jgi:hypothetical protein
MDRIYIPRITQQCKTEAFVKKVFLEKHLAIVAKVEFEHTLTTQAHENIYAAHVYIQEWLNPKMGDDIAHEIERRVYYDEFLAPHGSWLCLRYTQTHLEKKVLSLEEQKVHLEERVVHLEERVVHLEERVVHLEEQKVHLEKQQQRRADEPAEKRLKEQPAQVEQAQVEQAQAQQQEDENEITREKCHGCQLFALGYGGENQLGHACLGY